MAGLFKIIMCLMLSYLFCNENISYNNTEQIKKKTLDTTTDAFKKLNSDTHIFSKEFFKDDPFKEIENAELDITKYLYDKTKSVKKNDDESSYITEDLKITESYDDSNIIKEVEIPGINKKSLSVDIRDGSIIIKYNKNKNISLKNDLNGPVTEKKFFKKINLPSNANTSEFRYRVNNNKVIIMLRKNNSLK
ncbi:MAG: Hsp20/alpha crystallin family protein [Elusimicrobiales bacterium]|jgi:HSP20 family molecular chaperone IbpA|nr:Hsp20/alpha crystallin family protein [Elusimicrobiales bacterium]NLH39151.1 Hsp20 family protein [Elusimicrobiota bacterium]